MNPAYPQVSARADHRCEYCHAPELIFNFPFEVEHIIPLVQGGRDTDDNLALACRSCNLHPNIRSTLMDAVRVVSGVRGAMEQRTDIRRHCRPDQIVTVIRQWKFGKLTKTGSY
ncbi:HNH endonuclease [Candidatus Contendibacter odensensis]|uniref:HNH nuclease domain-containing protein n=1 Tax=Candidatus Contendobacter odensis Run_B_J11 TaxID=1400861 RepID=A0A7U7GFX6_9GAMM|nr:HNH endonuclease signature motif containing protein [Candidatus Contendobacter odensis]CDH47543.1 hypothetical protein BN874_840006 [Candidatus Contendobacter odensis Run_B_J11]